MKTTTYLESLSRRYTKSRKCANPNCLEDVKFNTLGRKAIYCADECKNLVGNTVAQLRSDLAKLEQLSNNPHISNHDAKLVREATSLLKWKLGEFHTTN
jgi:hypothetical protein